jgi:hypothetical protein
MLTLRECSKRAGSLAIVQMRPELMNWVNSGGGPLVCSEVSIAARWRGVSGISVSSQYDSDYARACLVQDYVEYIPCGEGGVVILGDEPLQSKFVQMATGEWAIVRWIYAASAAHVTSALTSIHSASTLSPPLQIDLHEGELVMFDSAIDGAGEPDQNPQIEINVGRYYVTTERITLNKAADLIVHRFLSKRPAT